MRRNDFVHQPINLGDVSFALNWIVLALPFLASFGSGGFIVDDATYLWSKEAKHLNKAKPEWKIRLSPWTRSESLVLQVCCRTWIHEGEGDIGLWGVCRYGEDVRGWSG
jgi:hypothetical protein